MSCREISRAQFARTTPVKPPTVKRNKNPKTHNMGAANVIGAPWSVANQEKILMPVGMAIIIVAEVK